MKRRRKDLVMDGEPFIIDPQTQELGHICCHCNESHDVEFDVTDDGRIIMWWKVNNRRSAALRRKK